MSSHSEAVELHRRFSNLLPNTFLCTYPPQKKKIHDRFRTIKTFFLIENKLNADMDRTHDRE